MTDIKQNISEVERREEVYKITDKIHADNVAITDEELDAAVARSLESPGIREMLENAAATEAANIADDEQLDKAIDAVLESPEVVAMLENVAVDAAQDAAAASVNVYRKDESGNYTLTKDGGADYLAELRKDFEEFKIKVTAAFKHAGFKF